MKETTPENLDLAPKDETVIIEAPKPLSAEDPKSLSAEDLKNLGELAGNENPEQILDIFEKFIDKKINELIETSSHKDAMIESLTEKLNRQFKDKTITVREEDIPVRLGGEITEEQLVEKFINREGGLLARTLANYDLEVNNG